MIIFFVFVSHFYFLMYEGSIFHYEFTNIKGIKYNSTPLPLSGVQTPQQNFTLQEGKLTQYRQGHYLIALWRALWRCILSWHYCNPDRRIKSNKISAQLILPGLRHSTGPEQWNPQIWQRFPLHSEPLLAFRGRNQPKRNTKQYSLGSVSL